MSNVKGGSEQSIRERLQAGEVTFPPLRLWLSFRDVQREQHTDDVLEVEWQGHTARFVLECRALSTPKILDAAIAQVQRDARLLDLHPMVIVPYLSEDSLRLLEGAGVSGIDLCGNGVVVAPEMAVWRSGQPNRFKSSLPLRNVYRGTSSLIARSFLLRSQFASLGELQAFAQERLIQQGKEQTSQRLAKGTVSKVVQALEEEKIVLRDQGKLRLLSPQVLLERLQANVRKPSGKRVQGKTPLAVPEVWERLRTSPVRCVTTGLGSAGHYRVLSGSETLSLYVDDMEEAARLVSVTTGAVFPNIELTQEPDEVVYFDAREENGTLWASPIQTWLELARGGPREREAAEMLEEILRRGAGETLS